MLSPATVALQAIAESTDHGRPGGNWDATTRRPAFRMLPSSAPLRARSGSAGPNPATPPRPPSVSTPAPPTPPGAIGPDALTEDLAAPTRLWDDDFALVLERKLGDHPAKALARRYVAALPEVYKDQHTPYEAVKDLAKRELLEEPGQLELSAHWLKGHLVESVETSPDGLQGEEGTFSICTFWYVDALARSGRLDEARLTFEKMLTYANLVGRFADEIGLTGEQLGNFPQAFTHLSLINAAINLDYQLDHGAGRLDVIR